MVYRELSPLSKWLTFSLFSLDPGRRRTQAVEFFLFEAPRVVMLLILVVFVVGVLRSFFTPDRARRILSGKREIVGSVMAALLGTVTPFCSCSAVPLFIGFVTSGVPLGVTFAFLISAPMVNEIALVLLYELFGMKVAAIYLGTGLLIALSSGLVIGRMRMEKHVQEWVYGSPEAGEIPEAGEETMTWANRFRFGREAVRDIVGRIFPYLLAGIAMGAVIHGYVPENFLATVLGAGAWWSVPLAVTLGIPLYSNAAGVIPVVQALLEKGVALGTALAFMMSVIGLSLPEMIILRKVLKTRLIAAFAGVVAAGILIFGFLFNLVM